MSIKYVGVDPSERLQGGGYYRLSLAVGLFDSNKDFQELYDRVLVGGVARPVTPRPPVADVRVAVMDVHVTAAPPALSVEQWAEAIAAGDVDVTRVEKIAPHRANNAAELTAQRAQDEEAQKTAGLFTAIERALGRTAGFVVLVLVLLVVIQVAPLLLKRSAPS